MIRLRNDGMPAPLTVFDTSSGLEGCHRDHGTFGAKREDMQTPSELQMALDIEKRRTSWKAVHERLIFEPAPRIRIPTEAT